MSTQLPVQRRGPPSLYDKPSKLFTPYKGPAVGPSKNKRKSTLPGDPVPSPPQSPPPPPSTAQPDATSEASEDIPLAKKVKMAQNPIVVDPSPPRKSAWDTDDRREDDHPSTDTLTLKDTFPIDDSPRKRTPPPVLKKTGPPGWGEEDDWTEVPVLEAPRTEIVPLPVANDEPDFNIRRTDSVPTPPAAAPAAHHSYPSPQSHRHSNSFHPYNSHSRPPHERHARSFAPPPSLSFHKHHDPAPHHERRPRSYSIAAATAPPPPSVANSTNNPNLVPVGDGHGRQAQETRPSTREEQSSERDRRYEHSDERERRHEQQNERDRRSERSRGVSVVEPSSSQREQERRRTREERPRTSADRGSESRHHRSRPREERTHGSTETHLASPDSGTNPSPPPYDLTSRPSDHVPPPHRSSSPSNGPAWRYRTVLPTSMLIPVLRGEKSWRRDEIQSASGCTKIRIIVNDDLRAPMMEVVGSPEAIECALEMIRRALREDVGPMLDPNIESGRDKDSRSKKVKESLKTLEAWCAFGLDYLENLGCSKEDFRNGVRPLVRTKNSEIMEWSQGLPHEEAPPVHEISPPSGGGGEEDSALLQRARSPGPRGMPTCSFTVQPHVLPALKGEEGRTLAYLALHTSTTLELVHTKSEHLLKIWGSREQVNVIEKFVDKILEAYKLVRKEGGGEEEGEEGQIRGTFLTTPPNSASAEDAPPVEADVTPPKLMRDVAVQSEVLKCDFEVQTTSLDGYLVTLSVEEKERVLGKMFGLKETKGCRPVVEVLGVVQRLLMKAVDSTPEPLSQVEIELEPSIEEGEILEDGIVVMNAD